MPGIVLGGESWFTRPAPTGPDQDCGRLLRRNTTEEAVPSAQAPMMATQTPAVLFAMKARPTATP
jgi:hypothetical protein